MAGNTRGLDSLTRVLCVSTGREAEGGGNTGHAEPPLGGLSNQRMALAKVQALGAGAGFQMGTDHSPLTAKVSPYLRSNLETSE